jgi:hypothetical protein
LHPNTERVDTTRSAESSFANKIFMIRNLPTLFNVGEWKSIKSRSFAPSKG